MNSTLLKIFVVISTFLVPHLTFAERGHSVATGVASQYTQSYTSGCYTTIIDVFISNGLEVGYYVLGGKKDDRKVLGVYVSEQDSCNGIFVYTYAYSFNDSVGGIESYVLPSRQSAGASTTNGAIAATQEIYYSDGSSYLMPVSLEFNFVFVPPEDARFDNERTTTEYDFGCFIATLRNVQLSTDSIPIAPTVKVGGVEKWLAGGSGFGYLYRYVSIGIGENNC